MSSSKKKPAKAPVLSDSRAVVPVGPRHVQARYQGKRDENGERPTTVKALVLRNSKYGARGTGEVVLVNKISGREKLDLLADDLVEATKKAVLAPFNVVDCLKKAQGSYHAYLDDITSLKDANSFFNIIDAEFNARTSDAEKKKKRDNSNYMASIVSAKIHNAYLLASAWGIVVQFLGDLQGEGINGRSAQTLLLQDEDLRARFFALWDVVGVIVDATQVNLSNLATTTPHYSKYFKKVTGVAGEEYYEFDWAATKMAYKSFLDSIVLELCFPMDTYPKMILFRILKEAIEEEPKEAKRFPQKLFDTVGDLAVVVELQTKLERLLLGPKGEELKAKRPHDELPPEYIAWQDAQLYSESALNRTETYEQIIFLLDKTKNKPALEKLWKVINANYVAVSKNDADTLWNVKDDLKPVGQWHAIKGAKERMGADSDDDRDYAPARRLSSKNAAKQITGYPHKADSDDSIPDLQTASESEDEDDDYHESSEEEDDDGDDDEEESEYDEDQEDEMKEFMREAMDIAAVDNEFYNARVPKAPEFEEMAAEQDKTNPNPFLKLLGSMRGRLFNSSSKLKTSTNKQPQAGPKIPEPPPKPKAAPRPTKPVFNEDEMPPLEPITPPRSTKPLPKSAKVTIEEVSDEDAPKKSSTKKKKKPKKKKKTATATGEGDEDDATAPAEPVELERPATPPPASPAVAPSPPASKKKPQPKAAAPAARPAATSISTTTAANMSTTSLPLPMEQTAQSARSYVKAEGIEAKTKTKTRGEALAPVEEKSRWYRFNKPKPKPEPDLDPADFKENKRSWFTRLSKRGNTHMRQLFKIDEKAGKAGMRWEQFVKIMTDMGFTYDKSTAGSSVRFDPPDERDTPITFHKPHPDSTIHPIMLREFSKRLQTHYGWTAEDLEAAAGA